MFTKIFSRMHFVCTFALLGWMSSSVHADVVYTGFEGSSHSAETGSSPGFTVGTSTNTFSVGGDGYTSAISYTTAFGTMGEVSAGMDYMNPILKAKSTGFANEGVYNSVGMMATYQFNGASSQTVTYNWALDAILTENDPDPNNNEPGDTAAFLRYRAGLITGAEAYETSYNNFFESNAFVEDGINFTSNVGGVVNVSGSISFVADPGEVFYLSTLLAPYAGRSGAVTDAFNTATGSFSVSGGGSISSLSAVPEPTAASILALFGIVGIAVRRRQR